MIIIHHYIIDLGLGLGYEVDLTFLFNAETAEISKNIYWTLVGIHLLSGVLEASPSNYQFGVLDIFSGKILKDFFYFTVSFLNELILDFKYSRSSHKITQSLELTKSKFRLYPIFPPSLSLSPYFYWPYPYAPENYNPKSFFSSYNPRFSAFQFPYHFHNCPHYWSDDYKPMIEIFNKNLFVQEKKIYINLHSYSQGPFYQLLIKQNYVSYFFFNFLIV